MGEKEASDEDLIMRPLLLDDNNVLKICQNYSKISKINQDAI